MDEPHDISGRFPEHSWRRNLVVRGDALVKNRILSWAAPITGKNLLDIGAGEAAFSLELATKINSEQLHVIDAVDFSVEWMNLQEASGIDIKGKVHNLDNPLPYRDGMFDVVVSNQVVEHLYDPVSHLKEIKRVLDASGHAIIGTCNLSSIQYRLELLLGLTPTTLKVGMYRYEIEKGKEAPQVTRFARHISCFTFRDFTKLLRSVGFSIIKARTSVIYLLPDFLEGMITRLFPLGNYMVFILKK
jgi:ubiquinone/menaquinone biosynthesis C-methylase UbiE